MKLKLWQIYLISASCLIDNTGSARAVGNRFQDDRYSKSVFSDSMRVAQLFPSSRFSLGMGSRVSSVNQDGRNVTVNVYNQDPQDEFLFNIAKKRVVIASLPSNAIMETPSGFVRFSVNQGEF
jgi:hypothetical protein